MGWKDDGMQKDILFFGWKKQVENRRKEQQHKIIKETHFDQQSVSNEAGV